MDYNEKLIERANYITELGNEALRKGDNSSSNFDVFQAEPSLSYSFETSALSFILDLYDKEHPYYKSLEEVMKYRYEHSLKSGIGIIKNIKKEIESGWISSIKSIVSAEIFSDFLENAQYLIDMDYKDPAAVMIGGVLEQHLHYLSIDNDIKITRKNKEGKEIPLKADHLNNELAKKQIYNKLVQKNVTAQLDLRNKSAHANYSEYDTEQVKMMYNFVLDFISKYPIN